MKDYTIATATGTVIAEVTHTELAPLPKFIILNPGMHRDRTAEFVVHAAGCRDLKKIPGAAFEHPFPAESVEALIADEVAVFEAQDQGWTADDFRVMPCCKPKNTAAAAAAAGTDLAERRSAAARKAAATRKANAAKVTL